LRFQCFYRLGRPVEIGHRGTIRLFQRLRRCYEFRSLPRLRSRLGFRDHIKLWGHGVELCLGRFRGRGGEFYLGLWGDDGQFCLWQFRGRG
jgi:hypothetical protein